MMRNTSRLEAEQPPEEMIIMLQKEVAMRFAAKEAVAKALGTGFSEGVTPRGIVVVKTPSGAPQVELDAPSKKIMDSLGGKKIFLSLTHTKDYAQAFAIITR